jgi:eukaryotic-like serine/threonine-protein kinase
LADYVAESASSWWTEQDLKFVARQLVGANSEFQPLLRENLRPIGQQLLPYLETLFSDTQSTDAQRLSAANAFTDYAGSDIPKLTRLLTVATPEQYAVLYPLVSATPAPVTVKELSTIAATLPPAELGSLDRISFGQRRANSAVTLLRLGEREPVLGVFDMTDDPEALTQFIFRCRERGVRVEELLDCLRIVRESPAERYPGNSCYALLLALGEYPLIEVPDSRREPLLKQLADIYRNDPRSGVHSATGWLLRRWGQADVVREVDQTPMPYSVNREWFTLAITVSPASTNESAVGVSSDGKRELPPKAFYYTFVVFPAGRSEIGSVSDEPDRTREGNVEVRRGVTLTRPFALLDREITMEEMIAFKPQYALYMNQFETTPQDAGFSIDWYDCVAFCRWLGQQAGIPESDQSYADPQALDSEAYPREPNPAADWAPRNWPLESGRPSFRLPTEAEWEVACRSGTRPAYGFGGDAGLLGRFGWFSENSGKHVHPPREMRPSVRGLFDMHGNVAEWTHDWLSDFDGSTIIDPMISEGGSYRVFRGGSWFYSAARCRSALRYSFDPTNRTYSYGFRIAQTPLAK